MSKAVKIKQRDIADCGAACLASVAAHYRLRLPVSRIRQYAGTDKRGTTVLGLIEVAEKLGFQAKAAKGPLESLSKIPLPAIAHVIVKNGLHHFVVLYKVTKKHICIMDPGDGAIHKKKLPDFKKECRQLRTARARQQCRQESSLDQLREAARRDREENVLEHRRPAAGDFL